LTGEVVVVGVAVMDVVVVNNRTTSITPPVNIIAITHSTLRVWISTSTSASRVRSILRMSSLLCAIVHRG